MRFEPVLQVGQPLLRKNASSYHLPASTPPLLPIHPIGIDNGVYRHEEHWYDNEEDSVGLNENSQYGNSAGELEQFRAALMRLHPNGIAAQRPWRPDPDEPVPFRVLEHDPDIVKEQPAANRERQVRTDLDSAVPQNDLQVYQEHKEAEYHDEAIVIRPKRCYVRSERIDTRYREEEEHEPREQQREEEQAPEFRHIAVNLAARVPVRGYLLGHLRIDRDTEREREQHQHQDNKNAFSHALLIIAAV